MFSLKYILNNIFFQAKKEKRLDNNKNLIFKTSQIDPLTCSQRKVKDVFTDKGSLAFLSKTVSRSAKATEIVYGEPDKIIQEILL
ncbi:MAG: hypothetical protein HYU63_00845, partial [Armatimonadetes bacterium]|nr:hypothetical protein [Armatimonadota bacterium]